MSITNKGKKWEILNSLWIIWAFVFLFNYISFFWIGVRAKQKKWVLFGCLYLVLGLVLPMVATSVLKGNVTIYNITMWIWFFSWVFGIIHSFLSRKEYLVRREILIAAKTDGNMAYRQKIQNQYLQQPQTMQAPIQQPGNQQNFINTQFNDQQPAQPQAPVHPAADQPAQRIDLNTCSEKQLADLPGVGSVLAKKASIIRNEAGFASVDDFNNKLGLMPHFAVQIDKLAYASPKPVKPESVNAGRVVDI
jgi:DNA uptake protein ComE-like DNA-binding protein